MTLGGFRSSSMACLGGLRELYADAAYDTENIRKGLESMGIEPNIPVNPRNGRRPRPYNVGLYRRMRSAVERFFGWIRSFRRIIIRYERLESTYKALVTIASITIHLRIRNLEMSSLYVGPVGALIRNG